MRARGLTKAERLARNADEAKGKEIGCILLTFRCGFQERKVCAENSLAKCARFCFLPLEGEFSGLPNRSQIKGPTAPAIPENVRKWKPPSSSLIRRRQWLVGG